MEENKKNSKKIVIRIIVGLVIVVLISVIAFLAIKLNNSADKNENSTHKVGETNSGTISNNANSVRNENSTAEKDMDLGLKFTKIDNQSANLTSEQKKIIEYFDYDYLDATNYEFLQRYPQVFKGTQIFTSGKVEKIINSNNDTYEILFWIGESKEKYDYWEFRGNPDYNYIYADENYNKYVEKNKNNYIIIKGAQSDTRLIVGDFVTVRGRYIDIQDYTIDGVGYNVPVINVHRTLIGEYDSYEHPIENYTAKEIKEIAKTIFRDVTIREPLEDEAYIYSNNFLMNPWYICELDNQSNAKFGKYFFSRVYGKRTNSRL